MLLDAALSKDGLLAKVLQLQEKEPREVQPRETQSQQNVMQNNPAYDPVPGSDNPVLKNLGPGDRLPDSQIYAGKSPSGKSSATSAEAEASEQGVSRSERPKREGPKRSQPGLSSGQPPPENDGSEGKSVRGSPFTRNSTLRGIQLKRAHRGVYKI